ncbi:PHP domain-containing protein [Streptomyces sp. NBC_01750]|uniref:PHP domain-containing protein n=1 Tax=Streptomyces sp. NBC_01750 TaxID=2975928 RepID=UPI003FA39B8F
MQLVVVDSGHPSSLGSCVTTPFRGPGCRKRGVEPPCGPGRRRHVGSRTAAEASAGAPRPTRLRVGDHDGPPYGASHPLDLVQRAAEGGLSTLALTDRDTVTGAVRFAKAAIEHGVRPVFGVALAVAPIAPVRTRSRRTPARGGAHTPPGPHCIPEHPPTACRVCRPWTGLKI